MDIVCPVIAKDFDRFKTLFRSLNKFCNDSFKIYLVSDTGETPIKNKKIIPIKEAKLDRALSLRKFKNRGWWKQQIVKLLSYKFCDSDQILSLDADCFAVKPFSFSEFLLHKKIKTKISSGGSWDNWYIGSASMLRLNLHSDWKQKRVGVTPFIFSRPILDGLWQYLTALYKYPTSTLLDHTHILPDDIKSSIDGATWSEYCLYHVYAVNSGSWDSYHIDNSNFDLYGNCFWNKNESDTWDASRSFNNPNFYFSVAQSIAGQSASWVDDKLSYYV